MKKLRKTELRRMTMKKPEAAKPSVPPENGARRFNPAGLAPEEELALWNIKQKKKRKAQS